MVMGLLGSTRNGERDEKKYIASIPGPQELFKNGILKNLALKLDHVYFLALSFFLRFSIFFFSLQGIAWSGLLFSIVCSAFGSSFVP